MKAVCLSRPKGDLQVEERARPSPKAGELLLRVKACGICHGDIMMRQGAFPFVRFPIKQLGKDGTFTALPKAQA